MEIVGAQRVQRLPRTVRSRRRLLVANRTAASGSRLRRPLTAASLRVAVVAPAPAALHLPAAARAGATGIGRHRVPAGRAEPARPDLARPVTGAAAVHARSST